jgi:hypothetical protein
MKKLAMVMAVLMLIALTAGSVMAKQKPAVLESLSGKVVTVDEKAGKIVIMANEKEQTLKAEPKLLKGIVVGETVNIQRLGHVLKSIQRADVNPPAIK